MQHLDEGTIHAWLDGALPAADAAAVERHAAECAECAALVAEARGLLAGASRIVAALDPVPAAAQPRVAGAPAPPATVVPTPVAARATPRPRRRWWSDPRHSAAAAAAVVLLAVGVFGVARVATDDEESASKATQVERTVLVASPASPPTAEAASRVAQSPPAAPLPSPVAPRGAPRVFDGRAGGTAGGAVSGATSEAATPLSVADAASGAAAGAAANEAPTTVPAADLAAPAPQQLGAVAATARAPSPSVAKAGSAIAPRDSTAVTVDARRGTGAAESLMAQAAPAMVALSGRVTSAAGEPLASATVRVQGTPRTTVTDTTGRYTIVGLAPGTYEVWAQRTGFVAARDSVRVAPGGALADFSLQPSATALSEVVVTGANAEPRREEARASEARARSRAAAAPSAAPAGAPTSTAPPREAARQLAGLEPRLEVPAAVRRGEAVSLRLVVRNGGSESTPLGAASYTVRFTITRADGRVVRTLTEQLGARAAGVGEVLAPGATRVFTRAWDQRDTAGALVPTGAYEVVATLAAGDGTGASRATPVLVTVGR